ncbi:copper amine oxidase N-terminal domain-containing protein [Paenibacillus paeoniae]|uniref:Copper amine oxidase N-terminal domain-containing protein n=1 Tax=Paenibacillus paeoniae TaxID=2292705 RepID=A0A371PIG1_9BACL|nr:copper amine oxidase N-terminal domain-containing protein [Paenibacillus paeoniae]REK75160.1 copper amine oxidase N-terminal domain-containing protein [Paenibacillus paeoniae]
MTAYKHSAGVSRLWMGTIALLVIIISLVAWQGRAAAEATANPIQVQLDEKVITFEKDPFKIEGTTLVQFRPLFEALGMDVEWDSANRMVTGTKDGLAIVLKIGSTQATVNGTPVTLLQAPQIQNGHTMVPLRFVSEATDALVAWNPYKPQILIYTASFLDSVGLSKEQVQAAIDKELERIKAEYEAEQEANAPVKPVTVPPVPKGSGEYKPAASDTVDLSKLQGMYYGFRSDYGGYDCGGICWDLYTFLPNSKLLIGEPSNGGPETIDCTKDKCNSYTIKNNVLTLDNGDTYSISKKDGNLVIDDVVLLRVKTSTNNLKLSKEYVYRGYWGLIGITGGSTSWTEKITFYANGTFKSNRLMLGTVQGGGTTTGTSSKNLSGSYRITGNTIVLAYSDGKVANRLFFLHEDKKRGELGSIQIGDNNFYVDSKD